MIQSFLTPAGALQSSAAAENHGLKELFTLFLL
jgi:hypothetical protein